MAQSQNNIPAHQDEEKIETFNMSVDISVLRTLWAQQLSLIRQYSLRGAGEKEPLLFSLTKEILQHYEGVYFLLDSSHITEDLQAFRMVLRLLEGTAVSGGFKVDPQEPLDDTPSALPSADFSEDDFSKAFSLIFSQLTLANEDIPRERKVEIVLGLSGAERTLTTALIKEFDDAVVLRPEDYAWDHPNFSALFSYYGDHLETATEPFTLTMTEALATAFSFEGHNLIIETSLAPPEFLSDLLYIFQSAGYKVNITILGCHPALVHAQELYRMALLKASTNRIFTYPDKDFFSKQTDLLSEVVSALRGIRPLPSVTVLNYSEDTPPTELPLSALKTDNLLPSLYTPSLAYRNLVLYQYMTERTKEMLDEEAKTLLLDDEIGTPLKGTLH